MKRKFLALILSVLMLVSLLPTAAFAAPAYGDTDGHWAESSINRWSGYGIVQGADGMFDPNGQLTCAQLATILVNLLKLPAAPSAGFTDNPDGSWFADAINRCAAAGILLGNGDGTVAPTQSISRDRTMVMLARALGVEPVANPDLSNYSDAAKVAPYAAGYVAALVDAGVVNGLTETELAPQEEINRASTVTILDKAISTYADKDGATVNVTDGKGITLIVADNVTVKGTVETLVVASSDANVKLDGVTAEKVAVTGEGNKVELANSKVETVVASGEKSAVETSGKTTVETVSIAAADASMSVGKGSTVETLTVTEAAANAEVKVASGASVQALETAAEKTTVDNSGVIATATIAESATGTEVKANSGSTISKVDNAAEGTTVSGSGKVENVTTSGDNTTISTPGTKVEASEGTSGTTADGKDVAGGSSTTTKPSTPSGGSSGGSSDVHSHSWGNGAVTKAATCTETGIKTYTCSCGQTRTEEIAALGHTLIDVAEVPATCTEDGKLAHKHCSVCGKNFIDGVEKTDEDLKIAAGHSYTDGVCTICGTIDENVKFYLGVTSGNTVDAIVTDDYKAVFRLPAVDSTVSTASVTMTAKMQNVASLGVNGLRQHEVTLNTGDTLGNHDVVLSGWLYRCYAFEGATIAATIDGNACAYTIAGINENKIVATTDTESARAAWQALASHVVTSAQPTDDSKIVIKKGSWMKIGKEWLRFEDGVAEDLVLDNFSNMSALQQKIRDAVCLDTDANGDWSKIVLFVKAGTQLAVGQSIATLKDDCTITITGNANQIYTKLGGKLAALRDTHDTYTMTKNLVELFDAVVGTIDASNNVTVNMEF